MMRLSGFSKGLPGISFYLLINGVLLSSLSWAATLNNFEINTDNSAVKIILHADQRVNYTTENDGKQFSIILPDTQLSQEQVKRGMPVVIDNKNKFIGRALPMEGGRVKITLPNLVPNRYAISVLQRTGSTTRPSTLLTRSPLNEDDHTFESIAKSFQENVQKAPSLAGYSVGIPEKRRALILPHRRLAKAHGHPARLANKPAMGKKSVPVVLVSKQLPKPFHENVTTVALADHNDAASLRPKVTSPLKHYQSSEAKSQTFKPYGVSQVQTSFWQKIKNTVTGLPTWLLGLLAVMSGGIGLLGLVGFFIFLRRLLAGTQRSVLNPVQQLNPVEQRSLQPVHTASVPLTPDQSPERAETSLLAFEDRAAINAFSYLIQPTHNIDEAVQNAVLLRLPHTLRKRDPKQRTPQSFGKKGATFPSPYGLQEKRPTTK